MTEWKGHMSMRCCFRSLLTVPVVIITDNYGKLPKLTQTQTLTGFIQFRVRDLGFTVKVRVRVSFW